MHCHGGTTPHLLFLHSFLPMTHPFESVQIREQVLDDLTGLTAIQDQ